MSVSNKTFLGIIVRSSFRSLMARDGLGGYTKGKQTMGSQNDLKNREFAYRAFGHGKRAEFGVLA